LDKFWELSNPLPNTINQEKVNDYLLSLKLANRSERSIYVYRNCLKHFFEDRQESYKDISSDTILQWFKSQPANLKETTLKFRLSVLSSFFTFCVQEDYIKRSPIKSRWYPRLPQPLPKYLEKEDIAKMNKQSEEASLRNRLLVEFMLNTGCRVGEVHQLNREDIDLENRTAHVVGKGKKIRYVHFTDKCAILLEKYLHTLPNNSTAVFVTSTGKQLGVRMIQRIIHEMGKEAGLSTPLYPHRLRHTFATELLAKGAELSFIGDELGHNDISTTQIYARLPKREIVTLYRKFMG
jgi:site-specific recombinase XerD